MTGGQCQTSPIAEIRMMGHGTRADTYPVVSERAARSTWRPSPWAIPVMAPPNCRLPVKACRTVE